MPGLMQAQTENAVLYRSTPRMRPATPVNSVSALKSGAHLAEYDRVAVEQGALKGKVLIVDDDDVLSELMAAMLSKLGYQAITAGNGVEALNTLKVCSIDIVLTDYQMPVMDGLILAGRIKEMALAMPVVMMTGLSGTEAEDMLAAGIIDEMVLKPFSLNEVNRILTNLLATCDRSIS